jgi:hypothetical protein
MNHHKICIILYQIDDNDNNNDDDDDNNSAINTWTTTIYIVSYCVKFYLCFELILYTVNNNPFDDALIVIPDLKVVKGIVCSTFIPNTGPPQKGDHRTLRVTTGCLV